MPLSPISPTFARTAGAGYLLIAVAGGFSIVFVPSVLIVPGDPAASLQRIAERHGLFLAGLGGDAVMMLAELVVTAMLYEMFRRVDATVALIAALARFAMVAVMAAMLLFQAGILMLAGGEPGATAFAPETGAALAGLLFFMHDSGVWVWQVFFAAHLMLLGWLVIRSGRFSRLLGVALMVGGTGYLADTLHAVVLPESDLLGLAKIVLLGLVTLAELGFALTLLIRAPVLARAAPDAVAQVAHGRNFPVAGGAESVYAPGL